MISSHLWPKVSEQSHRVQPQGSQRGFLLSLLAGIGGDTADTVVPTGYSKLGFYPGQVPEARVASPQWKNLFFVCLQMVLLLDT